MSLYGTGRSEGAMAACAIALYVLFLHVVGGGEPWLDVPNATATLLPALAGALCYRFLRAQGRSRFAAFLCGAGYGSSSWLAAIAQAPREQMAAALAPLALEAACRFDHPATRRDWLPFTWILIAAPFVAGPTVVAAATAALCALALVRTSMCGDRDDQLPPVRVALWTGLGTGLAALQLLRSDPLHALFGPTLALGSDDVLALHRDVAGLDLAAVVRAPGPLLVTAAVLGLLRGQRLVDPRTWLALAAAGALPTLFAAVPFLARATPLLASMPNLPAAAWWLLLLAGTVLAAAGLDDFLDLPLRRRGSLAWLLTVTSLAAPLLPALGAREPDREWQLALVPPLVAGLLFGWRRLGILRFKRVLAVGALLAAALPVLQSEAVLSARLAPLPPAEPPPEPPPMPLGDIAMPMPMPVELDPEHAARLDTEPGTTTPLRDNTGLLAALALAFVGGVLDRLLRTRRPARPAGAITSKRS